MLPIQYTTVQYSTVTGEEDGVTPHSTLCGVRGLDLLSVTNVNKMAYTAKDPHPPPPHNVVCFNS